MSTQFMKLGYEKVVLPEDGFYNVLLNGRIAGFNLDLRVNYYRGFALSTVQKLEITIDGKKIPADSIIFSLKGKQLPLAILPRLDMEYWGTNERAHLTVFNGGLESGSHEVTVNMELRCPYMSFGPGMHALVDSDCTKTMCLGEAKDFYEKHVDLKPANVTFAPKAEPVPVMNGIELGVSLYGFTQQFVEYDNNIEDLFKRLKHLGVRKFEVVGAQTFRNYPIPSDEEIDEMLRLAKEYDVEPFSYGGYIDFARPSDHDMGDEEMLFEMTCDLMTAKRLGCKYLRSGNLPARLYPKAVEIASYYGIVVCREIHAPERPGDSEIQELAAVFRELDSPWVGFVPDFGCYIERPNELSIERFLKMGAKRELLDYIIENRWGGLNENEMIEKVTSMGGGLAEKLAASEWFGYMSFAPADIEGFKTILPYAKYFHAKFYHIGPDCIETTIPYETLIGLIRESGFQGTLMIEYEGHAFGRNDAMEQIERHIRMEERILS